MRQGLRQRHGQGYEGQVGGEEVNGFGQEEGIADIDLFHTDYPRILAETVVQLAVSYIYGVHARGAPLDEAVGEAAGGGAGIQGGGAGCGDAPGFRPGVQGVGQFDAAPADEGEALADGQRGIRREEGAGFGYRAGGGGDGAGHNQCLGLLAAFGEAARGEQDIGTLAGWALRWGRHWTGVCWAGGCRIRRRRVRGYSPMKCGGRFSRKAR